MNEQSQLLQGQLLNELDTLSAELSDNLDLDNLGRTESQAHTGDLFEANERVDHHKSFDITPLDEFTSTLFEDATELAELLFSANDSQNKNATLLLSKQEIDSACSHINSFFRDLLNKHSTATEAKP